jgi:DNA-binding CsgD family transcriptional regulator
MRSVEPAKSDTSELLAAAWSALGRADWAEARSLCERALSIAESAEALEGLAVASWWQDDVATAIQARERAFVLRREAGQTIEAARLAGFLAWDHGAMRGATAVANGWLQRAWRLAAELPPSAEQGWLLLIEASFHLDTDPKEVLRLSTEAAEFSRAHGALDIEMTARTLRGLALVSLGRVDEGNTLLDEGTAAATAGELHDPIAIGSCCCNMIIACERARDFDRAGQWCEQLAGFCERTGQRPLLALCRAHHGVVLTMRGNWGEAEEELAWASSELAALRPPLAGYARARFADLRRRQGRFGEARELLDQGGAHILVVLVRGAVALDEGDPTAAIGTAERYLRRLGDDQPIESAAALELLVAAAIKLGKLDSARDAHARLAAIADAVRTDSLRAAERACAGSIALAKGTYDAAARAFEDAIDLHERAVAPLEVAAARIGLSRSLAAQNRTEAAREQALAAAAAFAELGAEKALQEADKLLAWLGGRGSARDRGTLTPRELQVLSLVAEGLSNREIAERLIVSEHTVHRHVANIYTRLGVSSRAAAVAVAAERGLLG